MKALVEIEPMLFLYTLFFIDYRNFRQQRLFDFSILNV